MKMKNNTAAMMIMMAAAAMGEGHGMMFSSKPHKDFNKSSKESKEPIQPAGTKTYFFNDVGEFSTEHMKKDECVFICFAINDKNAKRKFDKWKKSYS